MTLSENEFVDYESALQIKMPVWLELLDKLVPLAYSSRVDVAGKLLSGGQRLLDVGAGPSPLIRQYGYSRYRELAAADLGGSLLQDLKKWARPHQLKLTTYAGDFLKVRIDQKFDTITALAYLEHVVSPFAHLQKMSELLKKNGQLIVEVPNVAYVLHRWSLLWGKFPTTAAHRHCIPGVDEAHLRFFTPHTLQQLLEYCGFEVVSVQASGRFMTWRQHWQGLWPDIIIEAKKVRNCPSLSPINQ